MHKDGHRCSQENTEESESYAPTSVHIQTIRLIMAFPCTNFNATIIPERFYTDWLSCIHIYGLIVVYQPLGMEKKRAKVECEQHIAKFSACIFKFNERFSENFSLNEPLFVMRHKIVLNQNSELFDNVHTRSYTYIRTNGSTEEWAYTYNMDGPLQNPLPQTCALVIFHVIQCARWHTNRKLVRSNNRLSFPKFEWNGITNLFTTIPIDFIYIYNWIGACSCVVCIVIHPMASFFFLNWRLFCVQEQLERYILI